MLFLNKMVIYNNLNLFLKCHLVEMEKEANFHFTATGKNPK